MTTAAADTQHSILCKRKNVLNSATCLSTSQNQYVLFVGFRLHRLTMRMECDERRATEKQNSSTYPHSLLCSIVQLKYMSVDCKHWQREREPVESWTFYILTTSVCWHTSTEQMDGWWSGHFHSAHIKRHTCMAQRFSILSIVDSEHFLSIFVWRSITVDVCCLFSV